MVGDRQLDSPDLRTALAIITKRLDTGGAWIVSNNPRAKYWESDPDGRHIGNRHFRLADLVRASTAAPYYFAPQEIADRPRPATRPVRRRRHHAAQQPGAGAAPARDNPGLWLRLASRGRPAPHHLGRDRGTARPDEPRHGAPRARRAARHRGAREHGHRLRAARCSTMLHMLGRTHTPWASTARSATSAASALRRSRSSHFERYDVRLERDWLKRELGLPSASTRSRRSASTMATRCRSPTRSARRWRTNREARASRARLRDRALAERPEVPRLGGEAPVRHVAEHRIGERRSAGAQHDEVGRVAGERRAQALSDAAIRAERVAVPSKSPMARMPKLAVPNTGRPAVIPISTACHRPAAICRQCRDRDRGGERECSDERHPARPPSGPRSTASGPRAERDRRAGPRRRRRGCP